MVSSTAGGGSRPLPPRHPDGTRHAGAIVVVLAAVGVVVSLLQTLMVPLIPALPTLLHTSAANASWAITATLLAGAVANPVFGRLGDLYGKRRMLLTAALALAAGCLVSALSDTLAPMVVGRAMQGLGLAVIPLGISLMRDLLPPNRMIPAMALMSSSLGVGGALGLPLGAVIAEKADWHVLFWGAAVGVLLLAGLVRLTVPESPVRGAGRFDVPGAVLLTAGLLALLLAISKGGDWGWSSGVTLGLLGAAVVVLVLWGRWETRVKAPLVDLRTTAQRQVLLTNIASVVLGFSMYAMSLISPQVLQLPKEVGHGLGQSMLASGLWMAPAGLVMMAMSPLAGRLILAYGPKTALVAGGIVITGGYLLGLGLMGSPVGVLVFAAVISGGVGLAYAAMPTLIMNAVPAAEGAAGNGLNTLMRAIGTSSASAVIGVVLAHMTVPLGPAEVPSLGGLRIGLLIGAGTAVIACLVALGIPGRGMARAAAPPPSRPADQPADLATTSAVSE